MNDSASSKIPVAGERQFALTVRPQTAGRSWQARISSGDADEPRCFDRPVDLVLYLTELDDGAEGARRGLR